MSLISVTDSMSTQAAVIGYTSSTDIRALIHLEVADNKALKRLEVVNEARVSPLLSLSEILRRGVMKNSLREFKLGYTLSEFRFRVYVVRQLPPSSV